jgi:ubiquinone biosynthesis protein
MTIAASALAEGSVAVVVPFNYLENGRLQHGVFKVLRPGVETRMAEELAILDELAAFLEERGRQLGLPPLDYRDNLKSVQRLLAKEIRLDIEQCNLQAAAAFYAGEPRILVPRLLPWCTPRVTAMERVFGTKVTDAAISRERRQELADTMISTLLAEPFWVKSELAAFHADLHAGNLLLCEDGRLAVLDWSLTASLPKTHREALVAIALGGLALDCRKICQAVATLGTLDENDPTLAQVVERSLDHLVLRGRLPGFGWLLEMLDELALLCATGFRTDFALFRKSWLSLSGVIGDLIGNRSPDIPLLAVGVRQFLDEVPARLTAPFHSLDFSTHFSNADIVQLGASSWLTSLRYWTRLANGALRAARPDLPARCGGATAPP